MRGTGEAGSVLSGEEATKGQAWASQIMQGIDRVECKKLSPIAEVDKIRGQ